MNDTVKIFPSMTYINGGTKVLIVQPDKGSKWDNTRGVYTVEAEQIFDWLQSVFAGLTLAELQDVLTRRGYVK